MKSRVADPDPYLKKGKYGAGPVFKKRANTDPDPKKTLELWVNFMRVNSTLDPDQLYQGSGSTTDPGQVHYGSGIWVNTFRVPGQLHTGSGSVPRGSGSSQPGSGIRFNTIRDPDQLFQGSGSTTDPGQVHYRSGSAPSGIRVNTFRVPGQVNPDPGSVSTLSGIRVNSNRDPGQVHLGSRSTPPGIRVYSTRDPGPPGSATLTKRSGNITSNENVEAARNTRTTFSLLFSIF